LMIAVLVGFIGLSLDLARVYNRKAELQGIANVAALAAARQLNGTVTGVDNAAARALAAMAEFKYQYNQLPVNWSEAALSFSASPTGGWVDVQTARGAPDGLAYARADTSKLDDSMKTVALYFMKALSESLASTVVSATAVAGRSTIAVMPLAVCALSNTPAAGRANGPLPANIELVQFGFRRGVAYDLMQLNPNGTTPENFVVDPFSPPGTPGAAANIAPAFVGPFVCTGQLAMPRVTGGTITVGRTFPLGAVFNQLNSRFNKYDNALCSSANAPPDTNVRPYAANVNTGWMGAATIPQVAASTLVNGKLWTVADPPTQPAGTTGQMYGVLWAYARAAQWSSYVAGAAEPTTGYTTFALNNWGTLYGPAAPASAGGYPIGTSTPYKATSGANSLTPTGTTGMANRRVLNVPLLSCPVGGGALTTATVLGIGKFLMTVQATDTTLFAEFGGLASEQTLGAAVELYP
jgi:hypothetical protein